jgi:hypothetical protein
MLNIAGHHIRDGCGASQATVSKRSVGNQVCKCLLMTPPQWYMDVYMEACMQMPHILTYVVVSFK